MDNLILASQSPRRQHLLRQAGFDFKVVVSDVDETSPEGMPGKDLAVYLAEQKARAVAVQYPEDTIVGADTIVLLGNEVLGKPIDSEDAMAMLQKLSGKVHQVITGVCILRQGAKECFSEYTDVYFRALSMAQIQDYIRDFKPYDKAGSYAIQEPIGMLGIEKINGDYYNVMGLPIGALAMRLAQY